MEGEVDEAGHPGHHELHRLKVECIQAFVGVGIQQRPLAFLFPLAVKECQLDFLDVVFPPELIYRYRRYHSEFAGWSIKHLVPSWTARCAFVGFVLAMAWLGLNKLSDEILSAHMRMFDIVYFAPVSEHSKQGLLPAVLLDNRSIDLINVNLS